MKIDQAKLRPSEKSVNAGFSPKRISAFSDQSRSEIVYIDADRLIPYKKQARRFFDETEIDKLAETIKEHGLRQPLTVLPSEDDMFEVVSGERRLRACKKNGMTQLPCIVLKSLEKVEEIALVENIQRQDLHPVELAAALKELIQKRGWGGQAEVAHQLGMNPSQISELLKLTVLEGSVQSALLQKNIRGRDHFRKILALSNQERQLNYIESIDSPKEQRVHTKESVIRVYIEGDIVTLQANKIRSLTMEQKVKVLSTLELLVSDLAEECT